MDADGPRTFGALLRRHRLAAALSQEQLAERAGLTAQAVSALERGFRRAPYRDTVRALVRALALGEADAAALDAAVTRGRAATTATAGAAGGPACALPLAPSPLIGRERELTEVEALLHRAHADTPVRLLTLMGPGGVGKTRIALHVAHAVADQYADGAAFVALAPLRDPARVITAIAQVLRVKEVPERALAEALSLHLRQKHLLLLLDNFEHVVAAAPVIADLLAICPGLRVLVTSRARLHLRGEHLYLVPPLRTPTLAHALPFRELAQVPAVALLMDRAQAAAPDFVLNATTAPTIAALCNRLDGLPLALELAAPRLTTLSPAVLLLRLSSRLRVLTDGARDLPARQQTLRATLDWSYALLSAGEQAAFRRLSVFPAGCTREGAENVCMPGDTEGAHVDAVLAARDIAEWIGALVDQSLLHREGGSGDEPRFTMLETVREYGLERLAESGEVERMHRRHADDTLALTRMALPELDGPDQGTWLVRLEREQDNARAALGWARDHADGVLMQCLAGALWPFWLRRGSVAEGREWLDQALHLPTHDADTASPTRTQALIGAARLAIAQGAVDAAEPLVTDAIARARAQGERRLLIAALNAGGMLVGQRGQYPEATAHYEEALTHARAIGDPVSITTMLVHLGYMASLTGDAARGAPLYEESLALSRQGGDIGGIADALVALAWQAFHRSDYARVDTLAEEALAIFRTLGDAGRTAEALWLLGIVAQQERDFDRARMRHAEGLTLRRTHGDERGVAQSLSALTQIALWQGDIPGARELAMDALTILRQYHDRWPLAMILTLLGHVELAAGDIVQARAALGEGVQLFGEIGNPLYLPWCLDGLAGVAVAMGQFERAARLIGAGDALQRRLGSSLPPADPAGDTRTREAVRMRLGDEAAATARASGEALPLDAVIADALEATQ